jgi:hypothetical protein
VLGVCCSLYRFYNPEYTANIIARGSKKYAGLSWWTLIFQQQAKQPASP